MKSQTNDLNSYIDKIKKVEEMLEEIKNDIYLFDENFQESIKRGEKDIKDGNITICKTEEELEDFFESI